MMRTTIDLPVDLHDALRSLAASNRTSLSQTAVELMRRGLEGPAAAPGSGGRSPDISPVTGLPRVRLPRAVSPEDVRALEDDA